MTIDASAGSGADLSAFAVVNADVTASSGSQVRVNASGRLSADANSGSHVYYLGSPTDVTTNATSGAEILPK